MGRRRQTNLTLDRERCGRSEGIEEDPEGTLIPRSMSDKGRYYLLESKRNGDVVSALHKRVGVGSVGWTKTETNCRTWLMRELGYTEESPEKMKRAPTKWFRAVEGLEHRATSRTFVASRPPTSCAHERCPTSPSRRRKFASHRVRRCRYRTSTATRAKP